MEHKRQKKAACEFDKLNIPEVILQGIHQLGFTEMTPIQRESLPISLEGQDVTGQAQTGTGKTAAFLITVMKRLHKREDPKRTEPYCLILAPTRELAHQIHKEAQALGKFADFRTVVVYGGVGYTNQEKKLAEGVDIVIGTPGRLLDFVKQRKLILDKIEILVIDEADRLLDMGFQDELRAILRKMPKPDRRQSLLFSATLDSRTKSLANGYMNKPVDVAIHPEKITADHIEEAVFHVDRDEKIPLLLGLLAKGDITKGLIFSNMKMRAAFIAEKLKLNGYEVEVLTGDLPQSKRQYVLDKFNAGEIQLLVASDVASRGLHIDDVTHIFNFDVPQDPEDYVHRIGRTARAGKTGVAYTLACDEYVYHLEDIESLLDRRLPYRIPEADDFGEDKEPSFNYSSFRRRMRRNKPGGGGSYGGNRPGNRNSGPPRGRGPSRGGRPGGGGGRNRGGSRSR